MDSSRGTQRRSTIVLLVAALVGLAIAFGLIAAMLTPDADSPECPAPVTVTSTSTVTITSSTPTERKKPEPKSEESKPANPPAPEQQKPATPQNPEHHGAANHLRTVRHHNAESPGPKHQSPPSRLRPFLITFTAALVTGAAVLTIARLSRPTARHGSAAQWPNRTAGGPPSGGTDAHHPEVPRQPPPTPTEPPARPVKLPTLTTSGVSGLTVDRGRSGAYDVYAATQVGLLHAKDGHTREDAYTLGGTPENGWVFLAVADGLGSAEDSHAAAQLATQTAVKLLRRFVSQIDPANPERDWNTIVPKIAAETARALDVPSVEERARQLSYEPGAASQAKRSAPACTLAFAALGPVYHNGYPLLWGCVGDTELITVDLDTGQQHWVTHNATKQAGGMISNVTRALPNDYQSITNGYRHLPPNTMTILASDGMADAIRQEPQQYAVLLPQIAGPSPKEWMFGQLVGFDLPGLHDDRTIVAAWPRRTMG